MPQCGASRPDPLFAAHSSSKDRIQAILARVVPIRDASRTRASPAKLVKPLFDGMGVLETTRAGPSSGAFGPTCELQTPCGGLTPALSGVLHRQPALPASIVPGELVSFKPSLGSTPTTCHPLSETSAGPLRT